MNYKRILVSLLAVSVVTSSVVPAFGASNEITEPFPNSGDSNITLEVKDTTSEGGGGPSGGGEDGDGGDGGDPINVIVATVPAELPIVMDVNTGEITVPSDAKIINHDANKSIKVTDIEVTSSGDWAIADFDDDFTSKPDNTKEMGLQFRGDNLETTGRFTLTSDNWVISKSSELPLNMKAKLPKQTEESKGTIAKASFTLDWSDGSQPDESNISVQWDNSPMLPNSRNTATFNWNSTDPENKIVSIESLDPTIASIPEFSEASLMRLNSGTQAVEVTAHQKGSTSIVATLASGETAEAKVDVYEIEGNTSDGSIEITVPGEGYEEGATVGGDSSIEIQIPVQGPDGEDTITVTPEIPETELQPGDNKVEVEVDINGVKVKITVVIHVAVTNPSDGLQQSVQEAQAMGFTFSSYEDGLQIDSFENKQFKSEINVPEQIGDFKVLKIGDNAFKGQSNLKKITLPSTIRAIGSYSFSGCTGLTDGLVIPYNTELVSSSLYGFEQPVYVMSTFPDTPCQLDSNLCSAIANHVYNGHKAYFKSDSKEIEVKKNNVSLFNYNVYLAQAKDYSLTWGYGVDVPEDLGKYYSLYYLNGIKADEAIGYNFSISGIGINNGSYAILYDDLSYHSAEYAEINDTGNGIGKVYFECSKDSKDVAPYGFPNVLINFTDGMILNGIDIDESWQVLDIKSLLNGLDWSRQPTSNYRFYYIYFDSIKDSYDVHNLYYAEITPSDGIDKTSWTQNIVGGNEVTVRRPDDSSTYLREQAGMLYYDADNKIISTVDYGAPISNNAEVFWGER